MTLREMEQNLNPGEKQRCSLFIEYAKQLRTYLAEANLALVHRLPDGSVAEIKDDRIICPLCTGVFELRDCIGEQAVLSLEHNPPEQYGASTPKILTCKACNNKHGGKMDRAIGRDLALQAFIDKTPGAVVQGAIRFQNKKLNASIKYVALDVFEMDMKPKTKAHFQRVFGVGNKPTAFSGKLELPSFDEVHSSVALLKIAHLMMFRRFGVDYILTPSGQAITESIGTVAPIMKNFGRIHVEFTAPLQNGIHHARIGQSHVFLVKYTLSFKESSFPVLVLIPGASDSALSAYREIDSTKGDIEISSYTVPKGELPAVHPEPYGYQRTWWTALKETGIINKDTSSTK